MGAADVASVASETRPLCGRRYDMGKGSNQHVVPHPKGWAVKSEGGERPTAVKATQREAIDIAREIARNQQSELIIHGEDGGIRERDSHGHDSRSSKG